MKTNARAMVLASLVADALSLGVHWIYDTDVIDKQFGRVTQLIKPGAKSYHPTKKRGEFTHYGDQTFTMLASLAEKGDFESEHFARSWQDLFKTYRGYVDKASRTTLENFTKGKTPQASGSSSTDLGGAVRISPLVYLYRQDLERLVRSSRAQTAMTHNHVHVIESAEFFARVAWQVLRKTPPSKALTLVLEQHFHREPYETWTSEGVESAAMNTRQAISMFGQMCEVSAAFPAVVHLIVKYGDDLKEALVENVMAGGDSAARGLLAGMVLGAYAGMDAIPQDWLYSLTKRQAIFRLLAGIDTAAA